MAQFQEHSNAFFERKKIFQKKKDSKDIRQYRELYCKISQWVSDFNALNKQSMGLDEHSQGTGGSAAQEDEEFVLPMDVDFQRCPISMEPFEAFWDDEEGGMMYRHAVKALLTESADSELFKLGKPTESDETVRYLIVHKRLVLDKWLADGRAVTLRDALLRYEHVTGGGMSYSMKMKAAAGEEQDDDDIFVLLDLSI